MDGVARGDTFCCHVDGHLQHSFHPVALVYGVGRASELVDGSNFPVAARGVLLCLSLFLAQPAVPTDYTQENGQCTERRHF